MKIVDRIKGSGGHVRNKLAVAVKSLRAKIAILAPAVVLPYSSYRLLGGSSTNIGQSIFNSLWNVFRSMLNTIAQGFGGMFADIFSGFGQSVVIMFQSFGFSMYSYGVWGPTMFVVGILLAVAVGYLFFTLIDGEKDLVEDEQDLG